MIRENIWNIKYNGMNILLTAIGSFSADCVVSSLKRSGCRVVGCDIYPSEWHPVSADCDAVYQVPFANDEMYVPFLKDICINESIQYVFPLTDLEIDVLRLYKHEFEDINVKLCIQSDHCLNIARDKYRQACCFAGDSHVKTPSSVLSSDFSDQISLPLIAKPVNGRSSEGLCRVQTESQLHEVCAKSGYVLQEIINGSVFTVDYVRDSDGNDFSVPREELLRTKNGAGTTVRVVPDDRLRKMASYVGEFLGVIGCINMEFIYDGSDFYLIDINPRFSAGVAFSSMVGYDMVLAHLNCFVGKQILPPVEYREQIVAKRYVEVKLCRK